jgi:hypothetical protein
MSLLTLTTVPSVRTTSTLAVQSVSGAEDPA